MEDRYHRTIQYMRISITDRCNFSCSYCCTGERKVSHTEILRYEEIYQIVKTAVRMGITHFRVTGGEPFVRKGCMEFLQELMEIPGVETVGITTNGFLLDQEKIRALKEIGLDSINISLDTMDKEWFAKLTGVDGYEKVREVIAECLTFGLKVKINAVWGFQKDENDVRKLLELAKEYKVALRFIEEMPMGTKRMRSDDCKSVVCSLLQTEGVSYQEIDNQKKVFGFGPASYVQFLGYKGVVGFIEPLHHKFCASCNRFRLTARGELRLCLYHADALDLRKIVRCGSLEKQKEELEAAFREAFARKPGEHNFLEKPSESVMYMIGG